MPPEQPSWDRKDFFRERKHERQEFGAQRWRDAPFVPPYHGPPREFIRWGPADFRKPPGHGKQGGWHQLGDSGHGCGPSRSAGKMVEMESYRPFYSRGDGKYFRSSIRDDRGSSSYNQRDWKGHAWESRNGSPSAAGRPHDSNNRKRSVDDILTYPSYGPSEFVNTCDQLHPKDLIDNKAIGSHGLGSGLRCEREISVGSKDQKPLKWSLSGGLSSQGSGISYSSRSKSSGDLNSSDGKAEVRQNHVAPLQLDPADCVSSAAPSDETTSKKKPRLGWGQGLAKFEKKKVEDPETSVNGGGSTCLVSNQEPNDSMTSNIDDKSPRFQALSQCASHVTYSSVACSSSPGVEEKLFGKAENINEDINELCDSSTVMSHNHSEGVTYNLEKLDVNAMSNLVSSLNEVIQPEDHSSVDSSFVHSTAVNKLLLSKVDVLKELETTEFEIDSLENELKSLKSKSGERCHDLSISSSSQLEGYMKPCQQEVFSKLITLPSSLQIDRCDDAVMDATAFSSGVVECACLGDKNEDVDSPGSATSKFTELSSVGKVISPSDDLGTFRHADIDGCSHLESEISASKDGKLVSDLGADAHNSSLDWHGIGENISCDVILSANKELAKGAFEALNHFLPNKNSNVEISGVHTNIPHCQNDTFLREKLAVRKQDLRLEERILTLKYRAFHHLWKEDMRLLSASKYRIKSHKKVEVTLRAKHGVYSKHRSRSSSPAGNLSLIPTMEFINFAGKLLSESQVKYHRNSLKMPALILDAKEKQHSGFVSSNGLVEDPRAVEKERSLINPWTSEEKDIFMDKLATFGKNFSKIASFLDHKTTADCVEFYYKNHKSDCFDKTKKKRTPIKHGKSAASTFLVTSGKNWSRETNAVSLDILSAASVVAAHGEIRNGNSQMASGRNSLGAWTESNILRVEDGITERSSSIDRETAAADALAGICGSLSSEAMSSCLTSSVDHGTSEWKCQKVDSVMKQFSASDVMQNIDDTCSDESCGELDPADWTDEEKCVFVQAFSSYGKDFAMISRRVKTRSRDQCRVFFSKVRKCLGLDLINPGAGNLDTCNGGDSNSDGSDMEDPYVLESTGFVDKQTSKVCNLPPSVSINEEGSNLSVAMKLQTDLSISEDNRGIQTLDRSNSEAVESVVSDVSCLEDAPQTKCWSHGNVDCGWLSEPPQKSVVQSYLETAKDQVTEQCTSGEVLDAEPCNLTSEMELKSSVQFSSKAFKDDLKVQERLVAKNKTGYRDEKCGPDAIGFTFAPLALHPVPLELDSTGTFTPQFSFAATNSKTLDSDSSHCDKLSIQDTMSSTNENLPKSDRNMGGRYLAKDCYLKKCNSSKSQSSAPRLSFLLPEQAAEHSRSVSDTEKPCRNGNVKLFGQILKSSGEENDKGTNTQKQGAKLKSHYRHVQGSSAALNFDRLNYLGLENVPMSFGFWDGNKIQTVSSLNDPSVLMAKYPTAFGNYPRTTARNGVTVLPSMDIRSNVVVPPFSMDMKPRQDLLSGTQQRHNGFDAASSLKQQGRVFGSVQDPVAALRLARTELYGVQNGSISSFIKEKSWRGDIGR